MFLKYGRYLSPDERDNVDTVDEEGNLLIIPSPPKLIDFQTKVCELTIV